MILYVLGCLVSPNIEQAYINVLGIVFYMKEITVLGSTHPHPKKKKLLR